MWRAACEALVLSEHRDRLIELALHAGFHVVLEILADARQIGDHVDAVLGRDARRGRRRNSAGFSGSPARRR